MPYFTEIQKQTILEINNNYALDMIKNGLNEDLKHSKGNNYKNNRNNNEREKITIREEITAEQLHWVDVAWL